MNSSAATARPALRRDGERRLLLGVCAGIARVLDADPAIVRAVTIVVGLFAGPLAVIAYVAIAVVVPRDDGRMLLGGDPLDRRENMIGWGGVVIACVLLIAVAPGFDLFWIGEPLSSPLLIAALLAGVIVLARANQERAREDRARQAGASGADAAHEPAATTDGDGEAETAPLPVATGGPLPATRVVPTAHLRTPGTPPTVEQPAPPPAPRGPSVFLIVAGVLVAAAAVVVILQALGAFDLSGRDVAVLLGAGALICGLTAAIGAGRRGTGVTLVTGIVLALGAAGTAALAGQLDDGVGERTVRPATAAQLEPEYRLGVGVLELDLRDVALPAGTTTVKADVGFGEVRVLVAPDVRVESVGDTVAGGDLDPQVTRPGVAAPVLRLDGHADAGAVRVERNGD